MFSDIYEIPTGTAGRVATMARPYGDAWLPGEMAQLAARGVTDLVSHLTPDEEFTLGLSSEAAACAGAGIRFRAYPIEDRGLPEQPEFDFFIERLAAIMRQGGFVVIHCRGGIGRSSVTAAALLVRLGTAPTAALDAIERARGFLIPDTPEQRDFILALGGGSPTRWKFRG
jgi:protein-tyrosine phosphatase